MTYIYIYHTVVCPPTKKNPNKPSGQFAICAKVQYMPLGTIWRDLEVIILSAINQTEKDKYHMISLVCEIYKDDTNKLIYRIEIDSQTKKTNLQ